jgi:hypothetical protein
VNHSFDARLLGVFDSDALADKKAPMGVNGRSGSQRCQRERYQPLVLRFIPSGTPDFRKALI